MTSASKEKVNLIPEAGEHDVIVGQNGSGKTAFACWLLERVPIAPIIVYDTKDEPKFKKLPASVLVETMEEAHKHIENMSCDYIIVRPPVELMGEPKMLDDMLWYHYIHFKHCPAYIDEAYTFQTGQGRAGRGLLALLTRGRSRGIGTIISTQRPVRLDRACITEAKKVYVFRLTDTADKKRLDDVIPNFSKEPNPVKHGFYFFQSGMESPVEMKPIKLDGRYDTGYTDRVGEGDKDGSDNTTETAPHQLPKRVWI
jgi:hypothetical protein